VYGDGLNPALRPSNSELRARERKSTHHDPAPEWTLSDDDDDVHDVHEGSAGSASSQDGFDSDIDDWGGDPDRPVFDPQTTERTRVRRGSEGWEVQPVASWDTALQMNLEPSPADAPPESPYENGYEHELANFDDDPDGRPGARPWEDTGRYNLYQPEDGESSDEW